MAMHQAVLNGHLDEKRALIAVEDLTGWPVDSVATGLSPDWPCSTTAPSEPTTPPTSPPPEPTTSPS